MPTNATTKSHHSAARKIKRSPHAAPGSAIVLLKQDHREVEDYFEEYKDLEDDKAKTVLAAKICAALKIHTQIEEEIFYPAAREATDDEDLLDEAVVEHAGAKHLISQIEAMGVGDDLYDAKITVLGEQIKHHVREEEQELFPEVEKSDMDVAAVGAKMAARKKELNAKAS